MKTIDLSRSLFDLTEEYPELIPVLVDMGFSGVAFPEMRSTHGKEMTIPAGAEKFDLDMDQVIRTLQDNGFEIGGD